MSSSPTGSVRDGTFIAECQVDLEPLLKEAHLTGRMVSRKPQWLRFSHPNYLQVCCCIEHLEIYICVYGA